MVEDSKIRDVEFGKRLVLLREKKDLSRTAAAKEIPIGLSSLQQYEAGILPGPKNIDKLQSFYKCNKIWFLTGAGVPYPDVCGPEGSQQSPALQSRFSPPTAPLPHPAAAIMPAPDYGGGIDPVLQAMSDIKDIFDSGDPILIPAIQANLNAFKRALLREQQFAQVIKENKELKERIARLETLCGRIPELEAKIESLQAENRALQEENKALRTDVNRLKATYEDPDGRGNNPAQNSA